VYLSRLYVIIRISSRLSGMGGVLAVLKGCNYKQTKITCSKEKNGAKDVSIDDNAFRP